MQLPDNVLFDRSLTDCELCFDDRDDAGRALADLLQPQGQLVLAIPAGGVPVGVAFARELGLELDALVVSKLTLPWNTEAGFGAIASDGTMQLNERLLVRLNMTEDEIRDRAEATHRKVERRAAILRAGRGALDLRGRDVILVDDGLASGFTMQVALRAARNLGARRRIVAVPTAPHDTVVRLAQEADAVICANIRRGRPFAVAAAYRRWADVDERVALDLLST